MHIEKVTLTAEIIILLRKKYGISNKLVKIKIKYNTKAPCGHVFFYHYFKTNIFVVDFYFNVVEISQGDYCFKILEVENITFESPAIYR